MSVAASQYSFHADRFGSRLFASLWVEAWGDQYPVDVAPFSSCTVQLLHQLDQALGLKPGEVLVDLGCGTGGVGLWLAQKQQTRLIGVDRCCDAVAIAMRRATNWGLTTPASFLVGDFCETALASASVDAVFSVDAFPAAQDIESALLEVRRVLKPSGVFVFTTRQLGPGGRHFSKMGGDWRRGLEQNGFFVVSVLTRSGVSEQWSNLYDQWLRHEPDLRRELEAETVDALIKEANDGIPKMQDGRPWYLIKAVVRV